MSITQFVCGLYMTILWIGEKKHQTTPNYMKKIEKKSANSFFDRSAWFRFD